MRACIIGLENVIEREEYYTKLVAIISFCCFIYLLISMFQYMCPTSKSFNGIILSLLVLELEIACTYIISLDTSCVFEVESTVNLV